MNLVLQLLYLSISSCVTFCIYQNKYLEVCCYSVGFFCIIDFGLHLLRINNLKLDMILHHNFALCVIFLLYYYTYLVENNIDDIHNIHNIDNVNNKNSLIKSFLLTEVSTIFLILNSLIKNNKLIILKKINQLFFVSTFIYYRIYYYLVNIIINSEINLFIMNISKNNFHLYYMYFGIYGLFIINIYWMILLLNKILNNL